jgi:hypothetical protein
VDVVWTLLALVICGGLIWFGLRIEPHWAARDGRSFICRSQVLTRNGDPLSRWSEARVTVTGDDNVDVVQKQFFRRRRSRWQVAAESQEPPRGRAIFLLHGFEDRSQVMTLKLPATSRAVPVLRSLIRR